MKKPISFRKLNRDNSPHLTQEGDYYDAVNGRIIMSDTQNTFSFVNEKGTEFKTSLPSVTVTNTAFTVHYNHGHSSQVIINHSLDEFHSLPNTNANHKIIAVTELKDRLFFISQQGSCYLFWEYINDALSLVYFNDFGATEYENLRIQTRYENEVTQKIYFVDSNSLWHLNVKTGTDAINTPLNQVKAFPDATLKNPELVSMIPGGSFEAGKVQYAYNLYSDSGAETKVSPFSGVYNVANRFVGLDDSENNSRAFKIRIEGIPEGFSVINIYRIFYTSKTATPEVNLIIEDDLSSNSYTFVDDNNLQESDSSLESLLFLGSDPFKAKDIAVKDNVMFPVNIEYADYDPDFDARAYGFNSVGDALIQDDVLGNLTIDSSTYNTVPETHDCINPSVKAEVGDMYYNVYRYQSNGSTLGVEGPNVSIRFVTNDRIPYSSQRTSITPGENSYANNFKIANAWGNMSFKRDEVYRFFIRFTNAKGQKSFSKWIADVRMPNVADSGFNISYEDGNGQLVVKDLGIVVDVTNPPSDAVSWEILREERGESDKTIKAQGFVNNHLLISEDNDKFVGDLVANPFVRCYHDNSGVSGGTFSDGLGNSYAYDFTTYAGIGVSNGSISSPNIAGYLSEVKDEGSTYKVVDYVLEFNSPEILDKRFQFDSSPDDYINFIGGIELTDQLTFSVSSKANTSVNTLTPVTSFEDLQPGQSANPYTVTRAFIKWNPTEGEVLVPGETAGGGRPQGFYYINSYIAAFFEHQCNNIVKVDIPGESLFIPKSSDRASTAYSWDAGGGNISTVIDNASLVFQDQSNNNFDYGSFVNDRLVFNTGYYNGGKDQGLGYYLTNGGNNVNAITTQTDKPKIIVVDYKTSIPNQYGGNTYDARQLNNPVVISDARPTTNTQRVIYGGDTYVSLWNHMRQQMYQGYYRRKTQRENVLIPVETSINLDLRHDSEFYSNLSKYQTTFSDYELPEDVYNRTSVYPVSNLKPLNFQEISKFDNRVLASDTKINGEVKDSWLRYRANNYIDLEGTHGAITGIQEDRDQLFVFQPEAISQLLINPRVQSVDPVGIQLGKGDLLYDYQYLTTTSGSINTHSITKTPYGIMYYDGLNNKLSLLNGSENPISDLKGMNSFFRSTIDKSLLSNDDPNNSNSVQCYYDHETKETYIIFNQGINSNVLVFSHVLDSFHFRHDFSFLHPINFRNRVFWTTNDGKHIHEHKVGNRGFYLGSYKDSSIEFITNPSYINSVFDTIRFNSDTSLNGVDQFNESIDKLTVYNEHQTTGEITLNSKDLIRKFREWRVNIPRESGSRNRIMSPYVFVKMSWTNNNNKLKDLKEVIVNYRPQTLDFT